MDVNPIKPETCWIGVDQSYSGFGLVVMDSDGNEDTHLWKFKSTGSEAGRLQEIYTTLLSFFIQKRSTYKTCHMAMEGYALGSKFNREKLGELGGIVKLSWYDVFGEDPAVYAPTVLKKFLTGKGTASKDQMLLAAQQKNASIKNHNVADAYAIALLLKESHELAG